ncbi:MAG: undecaprenyl/decaprenyl-phosphate alpha-N-acetylglucosaminyl 1-phosphate transferase, partial [candidate division Zixibacteria bacterium]|nr:undecaprenyl/decaprenyl-phosphate alpha-N-acetylglucosaminyl 1-phosphate transferase [candidate division Zixibacteria bacterium]
ARGGGIAIFISLVGGLLACRLFVENPLHEVFGLLPALSLVFFVGLLDDKFSLKPLHKLVLVVLAAVLAAWVLDAVAIVPGLLLVALVVYITNAVNLLDGANGLAGGVMVIFFAAAAMIFWMAKLPDYTLTALLIIPAIIGFLLFNIKGKLFMGDCGSLLLGFLAGIFLMKLSQTSSVLFLGGLLALLIPIADTAFVIVKRILSGNSLLHGDLNHTYNLLLGKSGSLGVMLVVYYTVAVILAVGGVLIAGG